MRSGISPARIAVPDSNPDIGDRARLNQATQPRPADRRARQMLDAVVRRFVVLGDLTVRYPDGSETAFRGRAGPVVRFAVSDWGAVRRMLLNPGLALGECVMDGRIAPEGCTIYEGLDFLLANQAAGGRAPVLAIQERLRAVLRRWAQWNPAGRARRNAAHHYDLDGRLYAMLLDPDRQYSCAYFARGDESLAEAQAAKKRHIAAKLCLDRPGLRVLDIGCGWGGLALSLARDYGAVVTGITLSEEQLAAARAAAEAAGLQRQVRFELVDYRRVSGTFDRIVSVGMFEHVGLNHYPRFFKAIHGLLAPDGVALVHAIGRSFGPAATNAWLEKYIFPGGYSPALSEVLPGAEAARLVVTDIEVLRLHYAKTLRCWRANLDARRAEIAALYDERFCRMFEFYLAAAELAFVHNGHMVWQMQLARQQDAVPLTRDYMAGR